MRGYAHVLHTLTLNVYGNHKVNHEGKFLDFAEFSKIILDNQNTGIWTFYMFGSVSLCIAPD